MSAAHTELADRLASLDLPPLFRAALADLLPRLSAVEASALLGAFERTENAAAEPWDEMRYLEPVA